VYLWIWRKEECVLANRELFDLDGLFGGTWERMTTTDPIDVLADLVARGFRLRVEPSGRLLVGPGSQLTEADRQAITAYKAALVKVLYVPPGGVQVPPVSPTLELTECDPLDPDLLAGVLDVVEQFRNRKRRVS
jgi:hypothetical protein